MTADLKLTTRKCANPLCSAEFRVLESSDQKYCSSYCATAGQQWKWNNKKRKKTTLPRPCKI